MKSNLWLVHLNISHLRNYCIFCGLLCVWTCNVQNNIPKPFDGPWHIMAEKWNEISYDILRNSFVLNSISCSQNLSFHNAYAVTICKSHSLILSKIGVDIRRDELSFMQFVLLLERFAVYRYCVSSHQMSFAKNKIDENWRIKVFFFPLVMAHWLSVTCKLLLYFIQIIFLFIF